MMYMPKGYEDKWCSQITDHSGLDYYSRNYKGIEGVALSHFPEWKWNNMKLQLILIP
jgi:hypothetical protein